MSSLQNLVACASEYVGPAPSSSSASAAAVGASPGPAMCVELFAIGATTPTSPASLGGAPKLLHHVLTLSADWRGVKPPEVEAPGPGEFALPLSALHPLQLEAARSCGLFVATGRTFQGSDGAMYQLWGLQAQAQRAQATQRRLQWPDLPLVPDGFSPATTTAGLCSLPLNCALSSPSAAKLQADRSRELLHQSQSAIEVYGPSDAAGTKTLALRALATDALVAHVRVTTRMQRDLELSTPLTRLLQGAAVAVAAAPAAAAAAAAPASGAARAAPTAAQLLHWSALMAARQVEVAGLLAAMQQAVEGVALGLYRSGVPPTGPAAAAPAGAGVAPAADAAAAEQQARRAAMQAMELVKMNQEHLKEELSACSDIAAGVKEPALEVEMAADWYALIRQQVARCLYRLVDNVRTHMQLLDWEQQLWQWLQLQSPTVAPAAAGVTSAVAAPPPPLPGQVPRTLLTNVANAVLEAAQQLGLQREPGSGGGGSAAAAGGRPQALAAASALATATLQDAVERSATAAADAAAAARTAAADPAADEVSLSGAMLAAAAAGLLPSSGALNRGVSAALDVASADVIAAAAAVAGGLLGKHPATAPLAAALTLVDQQSSLPSSSSGPTASSMAGPGGILSQSGIAAAAATSQLLSLLPQLQAAARRLLQCDPGAAPSLQVAGPWLKASTRFRALMATAVGFWATCSASTCAHVLLLSGARVRALQVVMAALGPELEQGVALAQSTLNALKGSRMYSDDVLAATLPGLTTILSLHIRGLVSVTYSLLLQLLCLPIVVRPQGPPTYGPTMRGPDGLPAPLSWTFLTTSCTLQQLATAAAAAAATAGLPAAPTSVSDPVLAALSPPSTTAQNLAPTPSLGAGWAPKMCILLLDPQAMDAPPSAGPVPTPAATPGAPRTLPDMVNEAASLLGWRLVRLDQALHDPSVSSLPDAEALKRVAELADACVVVGPPVEGGSSAVLQQLRGLGVPVLLTGELAANAEPTNIAQQLVARLLLSQLHAKAATVNARLARAALPALRRPSTPGTGALTRPPGQAPSGAQTPSRSTAGGAGGASTTAATAAAAMGPLVVTYVDDGPEAAKQLTAAAREMHFKVAGALAALATAGQQVASPALGTAANAVAAECSFLLDRQQLLFEGALAAADVLAQQQQQQQQQPQLVQAAPSLLPALSGTPTRAVPPDVPMPLPSMRGRPLTRQLTREAVPPLAPAAAPPTPFASAPLQSQPPLPPGIPPLPPGIEPLPQQQLQRQDTLPAAEEGGGVRRLYSFSRANQDDDLDSDAASVASASTLGFGTGRLPSMKKK